MNPWTALLESLHSALIDELVERNPNPKPVLEIPIRRNGFALPATTLTTLTMTRVTFSASEDSEGLAFLGLDEQCAKRLKTSTRALWESLAKRLKTEFAWHEIRPVIGAATELTIPSDGNPALPLPLRRVIWVPIRVGEGSAYLGVGI